MSNVMVKGVCLHDNGSTHGTSVGGRRLESQVDYSLSNDEIITFGVRVTSGERKATFSFVTLFHYSRPSIYRLYSLDENTNPKKKFLILPGSFDLTLNGGRGGS